MQYVDVVFPPRIAMGAQRRPGWKTSLTQVQSGNEFTNQDWSRARHSYELSFAVRTVSDYDVVVEHFHTMRGRFRKFPFKDILDFRVEAQRGLLLDDGDSPTTGYHLAKRYGSAGYFYDRRITRPAVGTVAIYRTRSSVIVDVTGSATINYSTGWVTFSPGTVHAGDVLSWAGQFWVPARYDVDELPGLIVDRRPGQNGELLVSCESIPVVEARE